ncbi:uncharacterized protein LOC100076155 [Ornithorhynchus anatinus]|uniref:uncharacterized protein LOC100076155 n=1 Tax=Ornithorhynchus anatinus TaxID=9258 RepID=UPI0010A80881|nr:uncharacterized protein LOC100076155 [Ornithorhynchus anatinus]
MKATHAFVLSVVLFAIFSDATSSMVKQDAANQKERPVISNPKQRPGQASQMARPATPGQTDKPGNNNQMGTQVGIAGSKNPSTGTVCPAIFSPVCGSDGKTYGNGCLFNEAKKKSNGKLTMSHEGKC